MKFQFTIYVATLFLLHSHLLHMNAITGNFHFSWLGCSPLVLEQKILQFSAALFIIEKFADYSEEAGFTQVHTGLLVTTCYRIT